MNKRITLHLDELIFDVQNITHKLGVSRDTGENLREVFHLQADSRQQDAALVRRALQKHLRHIESRLTAYLSPVPSKAEADNQPSEEKEYVLPLIFPDTWREELFGALAEAVHDCLVHAAVFEFLKIPAPQEAGLYRTLAQEGMDTIKSLVTARQPGAVRKPLQPF